MDIDKLAAWARERRSDTHEALLSSDMRFRLAERNGAKERAAQEKAVAAYQIESLRAIAEALGEQTGCPAHCPCQDHKHLLT